MAWKESPSFLVGSVSHQSRGHKDSEELPNVAADESLAFENIGDSF